VAEEDPAMRISTSILLLLATLTASSLAEDTQTAYCDYTDGGQISIQYSSSVKTEPRNGRVWSPGLTLYVQVPVVLGNAQIPLGAYSVHLVPERKNWTLVVNKNVTRGAAYDASQDVARAPMEIGEIPEPTKQLQLSFGHMADKQCSLRVYYQKIGAFVDFTEK
jgi:hypothetical protein